MIDKKWNILYIKDERSIFDLNTKIFDSLFKKADISLSRNETLRLYKNNNYDIVIGDLSIEPEGLAFLKQIQDLKPKQSIFALVSPKDEDKLFSIADLGINAIELTPEQFNQGLETISQFNPYS